MPGKKAEKAPQTAKVETREVIEPAPSLDPVDVLPPDEANELLEPGSGAPDVRKILERVRASSKPPSPVAEPESGDRTDYIAAARRAAQAAAMEMNRTQKASPSAKATAKPAGKAGAKAKPASASGQSSLFSRYRRPILMAVGAILLAAMAMPLVNTLTRSEAPAAIEEAVPEDNGPVTPTEPSTPERTSEALPEADAVAPDNGAAEAKALAESSATVAAPVADEPSAAPAASTAAATITAPHRQQPLSMR